MMLNSCFCCKFHDKETGKCNSDHEYCDFQYEEKFDLNDEDEQIESRRL